MASISKKQNVRMERRHRTEEAEKIRRGGLLAGILGMKYIRREARYKTEWGTKTALGVYLTARRIIEEGE